MHMNKWPDSYEEREYKILEPGEAFIDTSSFLKNRGFLELSGTVLRDGYVPIEYKDYRDAHKLCVTITNSGLVLLGYYTKFLERHKNEFDMHWNPQHLSIRIAGSSKAIDEVVQKLFADVRLIKPR